MSIIFVCLFVFISFLCNNFLPPLSLFSFFYHFSRSQKSRSVLIDDLPSGNYATFPQPSTNSRNPPHINEFDTPRQDVAKSAGKILRPKYAENAPIDSYQPLSPEFGLDQGSYQPLSPEFGLEFDLDSYPDMSLNTLAPAGSVDCPKCTLINTFTPLTQEFRCAACFNDLRLLAFSHIPLRAPRVDSLSSRHFDEVTDAEEVEINSGTCLRTASLRRSRTPSTEPNTQFDEEVMKRVCGHEAELDCDESKGGDEVLTQPMEVADDHDARVGRPRNSQPSPRLLPAGGASSNRSSTGPSSDPRADPDLSGEAPVSGIGSRGG